MEQESQHTSNPPTNTMAIVSLVSGILSWFIFPLIGAIVAIITGHMARKEIRNNFGVQTGDGLAIAGLILGYLNLVVMCLSLVFVLLVFGGMFGLAGCAILSDSASFVPTDAVIPPIPAG
jgi:hypothetical protein